MGHLLSWALLSGVAALAYFTSRGKPMSRRRWRALCYGVVLIIFLATLRLLFQLLGWW